MGGTCASFGALGSAVTSVLFVTRSNGVGTEAAMPDRMGSLKYVAAIVIIVTVARTTSASVMMRDEKCLVIT